ncbi:MAG: hypothetical protein IJP30_00415 [Clostridia bacterium]|nr:hypothetical protein [Clostridia bacterium]
MDREGIRKGFIEAAIKLGSESGVNAITSRNLEKTAGINQYYLYRVFDSVDDVMKQAADLARDTFLKLGIKSMSAYDVPIPENAFEGDCARLDYQFFKVLWEGMDREAELFMFYLRYYYNYIFPKKYSTEEDLAAFAPLLDKMRPHFKPGTDLINIVLHTMETMLPGIALIYNDIPRDRREIEAVVFRSVFAAMYPYLASAPDIADKFSYKGENEQVQA